VAFSQMFHDTGIPPVLAKKMYEKYSELQKTFMADAMTEEGLLQIVSQRLPGKDAKEVVATAHNEIKKMASKETQAIFDALPNDIMAPIYEIIYNQVKSYGATEGNAAAGNASSAVDVDKQIDAVQNKIASLDKNPMHTSEERTALVRDLIKLNATKAGQKK
jgi:hypothetical protein